jgi:methyl-accepting chemotaxis protein
MATAAERQALAQTKIATELAEISATLTQLATPDPNQAAIAKALAEIAAAVTNLIVEKVDPATGQKTWMVNFDMSSTTSP